MVFARFLKRVDLTPATLRNVLHLWSKVWAILTENGRGLTVVVILATAAEALFSIGSLYAIKLLVDAIGASLSAASMASAIFWNLGLTGALLLASVVAQSWANLARTQQGMVVSDLVDRKIHARAIAVDLSFYESPRYYDSLQKAREAGTQRPAGVVNNLLVLGRGTITLAGILVMMLAIEWRLLPVLLVSVGIALLVRLHFTRTLFAWRMKRTQMERRAGYLDWMLTSNVHAKELRLNHLGAHFSAIYSDLRASIRTEHLALERRRLLAELGVAVIGTAVFIAAAAYLVNLALVGALTIGQVVLFVLLLRRAEGAGNELVSGVSKLVDDHLYLSRLFDFLDTREMIAPQRKALTVPMPISEGIRIEGASFVYDGAAKPAVDTLDLVLKPGQIVALVGENGSGKTTLIKLLTRLYDPTSGRITLDGQDIRSFDPAAYRGLFSVIFQDYAMYPETVADNIWFGNVALPSDESAVRRAAEQAGADRFIAGLPRGYQTPLTKLFDDGHDLSIGQWQRVALARSFFPDSAFIIMDEPTSAVDPAAEFELFENFRERLGGRGALVISHRLSTVRQADYTYVLDHGRILEHGTHDELVARHGAYARLFDQQGQFYR